MTPRSIIVGVLQHIGLAVYVVCLFLFNPLRWIISLFVVFALIGAIFFDLSWFPALGFAALRIGLETFLHAYPKAWAPAWMASEFVPRPRSSAQQKRIVAR